MASVAVMLSGYMRIPDAAGNIQKLNLPLPNYYDNDRDPLLHSTSPAKIAPPFVRFTDRNGRFQFTGLPRMDNLPLRADYPHFV